ncbi:MAG TPA: hypothetical protein VHA53_08910 [Nitrolancea sp.]|nr:hypothetical protein [Nitrolancea sp.]
MIFRPLGLICALFSLMLVVVACGDSNNNSTSTANDSNQSTNTTNAQPVGFADAYQKLVDQKSFVMTAELSNLGGSLANLPGITDPTTIKIERNGADRKVQVITSSDRALLKLWRVDGQVYVDFGLGPTKSSGNDSPVAQLTPLLDADQQIIDGLAAQNATFTVTGSQKVNGIQSTVETARYDLSQATDSIFDAGAGTTVDAKIWVAQDGGFLTKADLTLNESGSGTANAGNGANVVINVTDIGKGNAIKAPL